MNQIAFDTHFAIVGRTWRFQNDWQHHNGRRVDLDVGIAIVIMLLGGVIGLFAFAFLFAAFNVLGLMTSRHRRALSKLLGIATPTAFLVIGMVTAPTAANAFGALMVMFTLPVGCAALLAYRLAHARSAS